MISTFRARRAPLFLLSAVVLATTACSDSTDTPPAPTQNIVALAQATPTLSTLTAALTAGALVPTLQGTGPFTVFAPVNSAFAALPAGVQDRLLAAGNIAILQKLLTYHVVPGRILAANLTEGQTLTSVEGSTLTITLAGSAQVNGRRIATTDIAATNGAVHLIDGVLTDNLDSVDVATIRGFTSLVNAAAAAGPNIVTALRGNGAGAGLTVFAPTDAAFTALGALPGNPTLSSVLTYHVVPARAPASTLSNNQQVTTLQGGTLRVLISGSSIRIQGRTNTVDVTATDVPARNGVIHVIDAVLLP